MRLAYFIGALNRGGLESLTLDICRQYGKTPYDFICVYRHEGNMSEDFKSSGAPLIQISKKRGYIRYLLALRKTFKEKHVAIVHSQTPSNTLLLSIALFGSGIKIITTFHGHLFAKAPWWQRKIVYSASERIICVSNYQKQYYEQNWKLPKENKLHVVYNGIDFSKIEKATSKVDARASAGIQLVSIGNFIKGRSQIVICKAIQRLKDQNIFGFDFFFVGRRDEREPWRYDECVHYCEEHHLDNAHFLGSREDVPELLKSMDGFVYSTAHDTFGIAALEAISAGLPIVVNDWLVMTEVCNLGLPVYSRAIRFFRTDDVTDCAEKMKVLLSDIETNYGQLRADCQLAAADAKQKYSIEKHIANLYAVYQSL